MYYCVLFLKVLVTLVIVRITHEKTNNGHDFRTKHVPS